MTAQDDKTRPDAVGAPLLRIMRRSLSFAITGNADALRQRPYRKWSRVGHALVKIPQRGGREIRALGGLVTMLVLAVPGALLAAAIAERTVKVA